MQSMEIFIVMWSIRTAAQAAGAAGCTPVQGLCPPESASCDMTVCKMDVQPKTKKKRRDE
jgi:hypothetical protein